MVSHRTKTILDKGISISFVIFGIILLNLEKSFDIAQGPSAIFLAGVFFLIMGLAPFINFSFKITKNFLSSLSTKPPTIKREVDIQAASINGYSVEKDVKVCNVCGEKYPESTIHRKCIMCGSPISTTD